MNKHHPLIGKYVLFVNRDPVVETIGPFKHTNTKPMTKELELGKVVKAEHNYVKVATPDKRQFFIYRRNILYTIPPDTDTQQTWTIRNLPYDMMI